MSIEVTLARAGLGILYESPNNLAGIRTFLGVARLSYKKFFQLATLVRRTCRACCSFRAEES